MRCGITDETIERLWTVIESFARKCAHSEPSNAIAAFVRDVDQRWHHHTWRPEDPSADDGLPDGTDAVVFVPIDHSEASRCRVATIPAKSWVFDWPAADGTRATQPPVPEDWPNEWLDEWVMLRLYLPLLIERQRAARAGRVFVFAHVAQTLDARIACTNGHSQWISNQANLHHAHRLRALVDGVLVGGTTAIHDDPRLTVRHVSGRDPRRIVLSARAGLLDGARDLHLLRGPGCLLFHGSSRTPPAHPSVDAVPLPEVDGRIAPGAVRAALAERGLTSVFIEGGAHTLSQFLAAGELDMLHIHIAPIVLGSGIPAFTLPTVERVQAGLRFVTEHFGLDDELLIEARVATPTQPTDRAPDDSGRASVATADRRSETDRQQASLR